MRFVNSGQQRLNWASNICRRRPSGSGCAVASLSRFGCGVSTQMIGISFVIVCGEGDAMGGGASRSCLGNRELTQHSGQCSGARAHQVGRYTRRTRYVRYAVTYGTSSRA